jgi:hypothetical protein
VLVVRGTDELTLAVDLAGRGTAHQGSA